MSVSQYSTAASQLLIERERERRARTHRGTARHLWRAAGRRCGSRARPSAGRSRATSPAGLRAHTKHPIPIRGTRTVQRADLHPDLDLDLDLDLGEPV